MDDLARFKKGHHAGDAYLCIHELEKTGHLALEVRWLKASDPRFCLSIDENLQQTPKSPKGNKGVCLQSVPSMNGGGLLPPSHSPYSLSGSVCLSRSDESMCELKYDESMYELKYDESMYEPKYDESMYEPKYDESMS
jgi:hypothetical protein